MDIGNRKIADYDAVLGAKFGKEGTPERARAEEEARLFFGGIKTVEEYDWAMARVEELLPLVDDNTPVDDPHSIELEMLSNLEADYSDEHFNIGRPALVDVMKLRMKDLGVNRQKLAELFKRLQS